jgi:hypothetical protein
MFGIDYKITFPFYHSKIYCMAKYCLTLTVGLSICIFVFRLNVQSQPTFNTATGTGALHSATGGGSNTADGYYALNSSTVGSTNVAVGYESLLSIITGYGNTAVGSYSLSSNNSSQNTAVGSNAMVEIGVVRRIPPWDIMPCI